MEVFDSLVVVCLVPLLGLLAGGLTTVAGMGGGLTLLAALAVLVGPHEALAWTAPALLVGNLHRVALYRREVDWRAAGLVALGAVPTAFAAGLVAAELPAWALAVALLGIGALGLAKATGRLRWTPPAWSTVPFGAAAGVLVAAGGGSGVVVGPLLLARGLKGVTYVSSMAVVAVCLHTSRLLAYGVAGMADRTTLVVGGLLALCIAGGNLLGDRVRRAVGERTQGRVQVGALVLCMGLAVGALV